MDHARADCVDPNALGRKVERGALGETDHAVLGGMVGGAARQADDPVTALGALRASPAGTVRITAVEHAANTVLWPVLETFLPTYPDIKVELMVDYGLTNIVREGFDAGVRLGEMVERDMIAVRIGSDQRMAVVGAPAYFGPHPPPRRPKSWRSTFASIFGSPR